MRRVIAPALLFATTLAGCGGEEGFNDSTVVATIGEAQLTAAQLEAYLLQAPEAPTIVQGQALVSLWLDHAGIAVADARGQALTDPGFRDQALEPEFLRASIAGLARQTRGDRPPPSDAQVDSLAALNQVRVYERFAFSIANPADTANNQRLVARMLALRTELGAISPETFSVNRIPAALTEGMDRSRTRAYTRNELPADVAAGLWRLEPGMVSDVLGGQGAVQVFVRVPSAEAREQLREWLAIRLNLQADAVFVDSLTAAANLTFADDAVTRMRDLAREPMSAASSAPLGTFGNGGEVTVADARSWLGVMPAAARANVILASDSGVSVLLHEMGKRAIMRPLAPPPSAEEIAETERAYAERVDSLNAVLRAAGGEGDPSARTAAWMSELLAGRRPVLNLPASLGLALRDRLEATVNHRALEWVVTRAGSAWTQKAGQTS